MAKSKSNPVISFFKRSTVLKVLVVLAVVGLGAGVLPLLHADNDYPYSKPDITLTQQTGNNAVTVSWPALTQEAKGNAPSITGWLYEWNKTTGSGDSQTQGISGHANGDSFVQGDLTCNITYNFEVEALHNSTEESPVATKTIPVTCATPVVTGFSVNTNSATISWSTASTDQLSFNVSFNGQVVAAGQSAGARSWSGAVTAACGGGTYTASVSETYSGGSATNSSTVTAKSANCPTPAPTPTPPKTTTPVKKTTTTSSSSGSGSAAATVLPGVPTDFSAVVQSSKIVELSWDADSASAGIQDYVLNRSTDNVNWTPLTTVTSTAYEDDTAAFNTTYYYQLQAVDNDGNASDFATTQATTAVFEGSSSKITSSDKVVTISLPNGAFDQDVNCTVNADSNSLSGVPKGEVALVGPYDLVCVGADGTVITSFKKPLDVSMNLSSVVAGYGNITAASTDGSKWTGIAKTSYDPKTEKLSFALTSAKSFAAFGSRHKSLVGTIVGVVLVLLLIGGAVLAFIFLRRRGSGPGASSAANGSIAASEFQEAVAKPNCTHLDQAQQVTPQSEGCQECLAAGTQWKALRICLICGHVGCSDDSEQQHALKHFQATGHPLIYDFNDPAGNQIGWCYIDQTYI